MVKACEGLAQEGKPPNKLSQKYIDQKGGVLLEFALTVPLFLTIVLTAAELIRGGFQYAMLQHAVHRASRYAALGYKESGMTATESVLYKINQLSGMQVENSGFTICPASEYPCNANSRGGSESWMRLEARVQLHLAFGGINPVLKADAVFRNEPKWVGITPAGGGGGQMGDGDDGDGGNGGGGNGGGGGHGPGKENSEGGY